MVRTIITVTPFRVTSDRRRGTVKTKHCYYSTLQLLMVTSLINVTPTTLTD